MRRVKPFPCALALILMFASILLAQRLPTDAGNDPKGAIDSLTKIPFTTEQASISSTAAGGAWSSPSTWVGGVVPGSGDNVTIVPGAAVVIDTNAAAANLTVGDGSLTPAILTFDPFTARSLTVNGDLNIQNTPAMLATPSTGTIIDHTVTIGGNLTNNGVLDLSTNNNQAGANLVFINATSNTFSGNGPTNDVRAITINKGIIGSTVLTVSVANFTVQGSTDDTSASGYLTVIAGTFKISGSFSGNHRTFAGANYTIPTAGGFCLNNANYNVAAQNGTATVSGLLQVTSGTMNIGTTASDALFVTQGHPNLSPWVLFEGGTLNISGGFKSDVGSGSIFLQTGGDMHLCTAGSVGRCLGSIQGTSVGGDIYIQNARPVPDDNNPDYVGHLGGPIGLVPTVVHFGTADTPPGARFTARGSLPNVILDTTTGPHTLTMIGNADHEIGDINIGTGGTWDIGTTNLKMTGNTFINNGTISAHDTSTISLFCGDGVFSGNGSFSGALNSFSAQCNTLTFSPTVGSIRARSIAINQGEVINAGKLIIGNNDAAPSALTFYGNGALDSSPVFDLGTSKMKLVYSHTGAHTAGPEIPPSRTLSELTCDECNGPITITGGDLTVDGPLKLGPALFDIGSDRLIHASGLVTRTTGWVRGTLVRKFTSTSGYTYFVGDTHLTPVFILPSAVPANPALVSVKPIDAPLAGIPAATTLSHSWAMEQSASLTAFVRFSYGDEDINGNESNYKIWCNSPQLPLLYSASSTSTSQNQTLVPVVTSFNGIWGIGASIPTISISGRVTAANGSGIANATVMLTGGSLAAPRMIQTGPFGTYIFGNVDPGGEYTVTASAKRNRFGTMERTVSSWTSVANVDFVANPPE